MLEQIEHWFTYHSPNEGQKLRYDMVRLKAKELAYVIMRECPDSDERDTAMHFLRQCALNANQSISMEKKVK